MGLFEHFPYTNFHELNLDWLLNVVKMLEQRVNSLEPVPPETEPAYLVVGKKGCPYTTITEAVNTAVKYCTPTNRVAIIVMEGSYNESVTLWPNPGIDIIGVGQVDIYTSSPYPYAAIYTCGAGIFMNLRMHITPGIDSYAMHYEVAGASSWQGGNTYFINCMFDGEAGCGLGNGLNLYFIHCNFRGGSDPAGVALYAHNYAGGDADSSMSLFVKDCEFSGLGIALRLDDAATINHSGKQSHMFITLIDNFLNQNFEHSLVYYGENYEDNIEYMPATAPLLHFNQCIGNSATNWNTTDWTIAQLVGIHARVSNTLNFFLFPIDVDCRDYDITYGTVTVQGVGEVTTPTRTGGTPQFVLGSNGQSFTGSGEYVTADNVHFTPKWTGI